MPTLMLYLAKKKLQHYTIWVVEQAGNAPFNRGKLLNIGAVLANNVADYFIFHDVDMLPQTADYTYSANPCHIATQCSQFGYKMPAPNYFGGVNIFDKNVFWQINGYSNNFWGWGSEDDENLLRVEAHGYTVERRQCRFLSLNHTRNFSYSAQNYELYKHIRSNPNHSADGLNSLQFNVLANNQHNHRTRWVTVQL